MHAAPHQTSGNAALGCPACLGMRGGGWVRHSRTHHENTSDAFILGTGTGERGPEQYHNNPAPQPHHLRLPHTTPNHRHTSWPGASSSEKSASKGPSRSAQTRSTSRCCCSPCPWQPLLLGPGSRPTDRLEAVSPRTSGCGGMAAAAAAADEAPAGAVALPSACPSCCSSCSKSVV